MVVNIGLRSGKADGRSIGNEVYLGAALGQLKTKVGSGPSAAAVSWIAGNPNFHASAFSRGMVGFPRTWIQILLGFTCGKGSGTTNLYERCRFLLPVLFLADQSRRCRAFRAVLADVPVRDCLDR